MNARRKIIAGLVIFALAPSTGALPRVVSINLCTDQLLLTLAEPEQILSLSWLAADPDESLLAAEASGYPVNYGTAEEVLAFDPDVVLAGSFTGSFTRQLLRRLGYAVHDIAPADSLLDIERNVLEVGRAIGREQHAQNVITDFRANLTALAPLSDAARVAFLRPGGFTFERQSLAADLIAHAGVRNVVAENGLDRWGSLPLETLVRTVPEIIAISRYETATPSLANGILDHPALAAAASRARVIHVPTRYWACGQPQSLAAVELLREGLGAVSRAPAAAELGTPARTRR